MKTFLLLAISNGILAVALGAFGAHGLEGKLSEQALLRWDKAVHYQMFHTMALFITGLLISKVNSTSIFWAGWLFFVGIILFSGSLYFYAATSVRTFAMITPFGGFSFLLGWLFLGYAVMRFL